VRDNTLNLKVGIMIKANALNTQDFKDVRSAGRGTVANYLKCLILFSITISIMVVLGEGIVRWVFQDITSTGDNRSYFAQRWKSNSHHVSLNSGGFRDTEVRMPKPEGVYRVAVVGDSFTFGQGINEEARFGNLLENNLNKLKPSTLEYEVLNFGRSGAETEDHLAILKEHVLAVKPDYVLLQWYINDFEGHNKKGRPPVRPLGGWGTYHRILHESSALYYLLNRQFSSLQYVVGYVGTYSDYMFERFGDPNSPGSLAFRKLLTEFIDISRSQHIPMGIVLFPSPQEEFGTPYPYAYLHEQVLTVCEQEGILCIDLLDVFKRYESHSLEVNRFDAHPSAFANRLAASRIFESFGPIWMGDVS